jgi:hypothetical protein
MKPSVFYPHINRLCWYSKQIVSGVLLITLLAVQVKILLEGCLVIPYLAAPQSMVPMEGPCAEPASSAERVCLANCEYSISKPKCAGEVSLLDVIVGLPTIIFAVDPFSFSPLPFYVVSMPAIGPPLYLLFLRIFIPIPFAHH